MKCTRREFIASTAAAATGVLLLPATLRGADPGGKPLRILILGGTGFLGPACTESALARGHSVTHFNSGRTEERRREAGRPSVVPSGVEQLHGNRDPNKTADDAIPGRVTNIRPGYIVGPRDTSGRFIYWPVRASLGGVMIVPGTPVDPIQVIDVRDLADWIIHCIENSLVGVYNATGPEKEL